MSVSAALLHLATIILLAWLAGCVILAALKLHPVTRVRTHGLWPLMVSEAAILLAGTLPWLLPQPVLGLTLAVAASRIGYESASVNGGSGQSRTGVFLLVVVALAAWLVGSENWQIGVAMLVLVIIAIVSLVSRHSGFTWLWRYLVFPVLPFGLFVLAARRFDLGFIFVLSFLIVEIFDSFSLLGGRLFGKRALVPRLSPRKTWEGLGVGLLAVAFSAIALAYVLDMELSFIVAIAIVSTAGALAGDLLASAAKRQAGVKDYPVILPIQGGLLDIMDGWIVAGPFAAFTAILLR